MGGGDRIGVMETFFWGGGWGAFIFNKKTS